MTMAYPLPPQIEQLMANFTLSKPTLIPSLLDVAPPNKHTKNYANLDFYIHARHFASSQHEHTAAYASADDGAIFAAETAAWEEAAQLVNTLREPSWDNALLRNVLWGRVHGLHGGLEGVLQSGCEQLLNSQAPLTMQDGMRTYILRQVDEVKMAVFTLVLQKVVGG